MEIFMKQISWTIKGETIDDQDCEVKALLYQDVVKSDEA